MEAEKGGVAASDALLDEILAFADQTSKKTHNQLNTEKTLQYLLYTMGKESFDAQEQPPKDAQVIQEAVAEWSANCDALEVLQKAVEKKFNSCVVSPDAKIILAFHKKLRWSVTDFLHIPDTTAPPGNENPWTPQDKRGNYSTLILDDIQIHVRPDQAEFLCTLHVVYNLHAYMSACIVEYFENKGKVESTGFLDCFEQLVNESEGIQGVMLAVEQASAFCHC